MLFFVSPCISGSKWQRREGRGRGIDSSGEISPYPFPRHVCAGFLAGCQCLYWQRPDSGGHAAAGYRLLPQTERRCDVWPLPRRLRLVRRLRIRRDCATPRRSGGEPRRRGAGVASSLATAPTTAHPRLQQVLGPLLQGWSLLRAILQVPPATRTRADGLGNEITVHMHSVLQLTETWIKKKINKTTAVSVYDLVYLDTGRRTKSVLTAH